MLMEWLRHPLAKRAFDYFSFSWNVKFNKLKCLVFPLPVLVSKSITASAMKIGKIVSIVSIGTNLMDIVW